MSGIGGMLGTAGGAAGTGFSGPTAAGIAEPVTAAQTTAAYNGVQGAMGSQNSLLSALQAQNGLQNQSSVYNQLQGVANGTGPNPAQAQLAQATGANTANQAALMAGQRGSSANTGLMARQAAMQGGANQQNSAGQAATMQANQSLNALGQMGGVAGTQAANQIGQTNANTSAQQAEQGQLLNSVAGVNNANVAMQSNMNNVNGQLANTQLQGQQSIMGGLMSSASGSGISKMLARGGRVRRYEEGGSVEPAPSDTAAPTSNEAPPTQDTVQAPAPEAAPPPEQAPAASFGSYSAGAAPAAAQASATPSFGTDAGAAALGAGAASFGGSGGGGGGGGGSSGGGMSSMMGLLAMMADGGEVSAGYEGQAPAAQNGPKSKFGQYVKSKKVEATPTEGTPKYSGGADALYQGAKDLGSSLMGSNQSQSPNQTDAQALAGYSQANQMLGNNPQNMLPASNPDNTMMAAKGGKVPALVSPGEIRIHAKDVGKVAKGANPLHIGEKIPGKPKVSGAKNSYANDTVPKSLNEGDIILPRSVTQSKNPHWAAHRFVSAIMAKNQGKKK